MFAKTTTHTSLPDWERLREEVAMARHTAEPRHG